MARDLILSHVFGKDTGRATRDVDLGICIDEWSELDSLKGRLTLGGYFTEQRQVAHRLIYRSPGRKHGIPLDLLPYGSIERADSTIAWPPDMDVVLNVAGFSEARRSAVLVEIAPAFAVSVTSLPSLAVLKLIAWRDRNLSSAKDASDFLLIARHYHDAGNVDRLYDVDSALLQETAFDPELAGAMLLGKDAAAICLPGTARRIVVILTDAQLRQRLLDQILRTALAEGDDAGSSRAQRLLDAFYRGFAET